MAVVRRRRQLATARQLAAASDSRHPYGPAKLYTIDQVIAYARRAGFSHRGGSGKLSGTDNLYPADVVATAIAFAESGGDARIVNPASGATGLWQIHPGGRALIVPTANATAARAKYAAQGWRAWSAFSSGAFRSHLGNAQEAWQRIEEGKGFTFDKGKVEPGLGLRHVPGEVGGLLTGWVGDLFHVLLPVLKIAAGGTGLLVTGGAIVFLAGRNVPISGDAVKAGLRVAPGGKAVTQAIETRQTVRRAATERATEVRRASARELGRARVVQETGRGGRERVRVTSTRSARAAQGQRAFSASAPRRGPRIIEGVRRRPRASAIRGHGATT